MTVRDAGLVGRTGRGSDLSWDCPVLHVDMDAFYASLATRDRPDLAHAPVVVGGGDRGVVLSASYAARAYGVTSAMPMTRARRLCPEVVVLPPDFTMVSRASAAVMALVRQLTPVVEVTSPDEAFLDVRGAGRRLGSPARVAELLRAAVADEQRVTCSVGVAATPTLAKMASRRAKPDGTLVVPPSQVTAFLHPLDVGELWGVGEKTREQLVRFGLHTVGDLAHTPEPVLQRALGPARGTQLHELAWGLDRRSVTARHAPDADEAGKSVGAEETFARDTDDRDVVLRELLRLSGRVSRRLRAAGQVGRTVTLTVRLSDFTTLTRSRTTSEPTDVTGEVYRGVRELYDRLGLQRARVRLVGVRVEGLRQRAGATRQAVLGESARGWPEVEQAMDRVGGRFGTRAVQQASLLSS